MLVTPHHINRGLQGGALFLLHQQRAVGAAEQSCRAGDHFKSISCRLFSCVVDGQHTDAMLVGKLFQPADNLVVAGVAICLAADLADFLHCVNDEEFGVGMFPDKVPR